MDFQLSFDSTQFEAALMDYGAKAITSMAQALEEEAEDIMGDSKEKFVPVDQGILSGSGHVQPAEILGNSVVVKMGYGGPAAPYAAAVHENPRAGKTGGVSPQGKKYKTWAKVGGWKYLERPINEHRQGFSQRVGERFWQLLARGMG
jgi:hypothetical protein